MRHRTALLEARRDLLVARSAYLRADLQLGASAIGRRLWLFDRIVAFARSGPGRVLLAGGFAVILVTGPRRWLAFAGRVFAAWPLVRTWVSGSLRSMR